jgi:ATP-binding cassette subfamily C (CFTR/MRP) protein 1
LALITLVPIFIRLVTILMFNLRGSTKLHEQMVAKVLNAPINLFYDVTPIGRTLNKFTKDIEALEIHLPWTINGFVWLISATICILIPACLAAPAIIVVLPAMLWVVVKIYRNSIHGYKEVRRLESTTKSPILSFFQETYHGTSTIRAFQL